MASPHPNLGAIAWTFSTSLCTGSLLFCVLVSWFDSGFLFIRQSTLLCTQCLRALVSGSHCSVLCSAEVCKKLGFLGDEWLFPLGSTADTWLASVFLSVHSALVVDNGIVTGFAGYDAPRAVFPSTAAGALQCLHFTLYSLSLSARPRFSAS